MKRRRERSDEGPRQRRVRVPIPDDPKAKKPKQVAIRQIPTKLMAPKCIFVREVPAVAPNPKRITVQVTPADRTPITVTCKVHVVRKAHGRKVVATAPRPAAHAPPGRVPRISRLMALAIRFDRLIAEGKVSDQSELARLAHVTQPRMTQIMNLLHLAPDIQEALLNLPLTITGRDAVHERMLRGVASKVDWHDQRRHWVGMQRSRFA